MSNDHWAQALFFLAGGLRAGLSLEESLNILLQEAPEPLRTLLHERLPGESRWLSLDERVNVLFKEEELALARAALTLAHQTGGRVAPLLERCAQTLQTKKEMAERLSALTAQGRASAWIVGATPAALLLLFAVISPDYIQPLLSTSQGHAVMLLAGFLIAMGLFMVRRAVRIE